MDEHAAPADRDVTALRAADFWTSLVLIAAALFFLWRTSLLPFFKASAAGVSAEWYNSAALVPYGVFAALLALGIGLLTISVREGGAARALGALSPRDMPWTTITKVVAATGILTLYVTALVPRVDFTIASALTITAMVYGFHEGRMRALAIASVAVAIPSLYALLLHFPQSEWTVPHDDDWVTLAAYVGLTIALMIEVGVSQGHLRSYALAAPIIGAFVPFVLVCAMAFGFRQNVPNRTGLIFSTVEYHYYVTLRPWVNGN